MLRLLHWSLLRFYPLRFRQRFGDELRFVLEAGWREARSHGAAAALSFIVLSVFDAGVNGFRERRQARLNFSHLNVEKDSLMTTFLLDLKFGFRLMTRNPRLAALAICTLALGMGLSVSLYSIAHGTLVRPMPFRDESQVVMLYEHAPQKGTIKGNVAPANFLDWRARSRAFANMGALRPFGVTVASPGGEPMRANGRRMLGDAFDALGLKPVHGRLLTPDDERQGVKVVVLGYRLWQRFGAEPSLVGRSITLDEVPHTVVGVLEPVLRVPGGPVGYDEIFVPWILTPQQRQARMSHICEAVARIKPGVTLEQAQAELAAVAEALATEFPQSNKDETVLLVPVREALVGEVRPALIVLVGAVTLVLVIACVNVANLLLARAMSRRQEMLVRAALGAGRVRLFRQLLAESLLLGGISGVVGLALAFRTVDALRAVLPPDLAAAVNVQIDVRVALAALAACIATAVAFGLSPAYFILRNHDAGVVRGGRSDASSAPARRALVVVQVALAVVLLTGTGLLMRSFVRLMGVDPGFNPDRLLTMALELPQTRYRGPAEWQPFFERLTADLRALPGVENAAGVSGLPMNENGGSVGYYVEGEPLPAANETTFVIYRLTTPGYFSTIGIPLLEGRDFSSADGPATGPRVVIVNRTFARRYWSGQSAIGKRVAFTTKPKPEDWATVVGVVGDIHHSSLAEAIDVQMYVPYTQEPDWFPPGQIVLRTAVDPTAVAADARERVRAIDPLIPVEDIQTMEAIIGRSVSTPRFHLTLLTILSVSALVLAVVGIYGLLAFSVALRTREIGVRSALGASRHAIARMILKEGLRLTTAGLVLGLAISFAATRWLAALLFQISPDDPLTFAGITALLLGVAALACYVPARRAAHVDPLIALRGE